MPPQLTRAWAWVTELALRAWALIADFARRAWALARRRPWLTGMLIPSLVLLYVLALIPFTPSISDIRKANSEVPSMVMSSDGVVLAEFRRLNREWVPLSRISPHVINALIATEDHRFYEHHGMDLRRTASALLQTLRGNNDQLEQDPSLIPRYFATTNPSNPNISVVRTDITAQDITNAQAALVQVLFTYDSGTPTNKSKLFKMLP